jgi:hypothetical protein
VEVAPVKLPGQQQLMLMVSLILVEVEVALETV